MSKFVLALIAVVAVSTSAYAQGPQVEAATELTNNAMDEINPFDPNIEQVLNEMDQDYQTQTGQAAQVDVLGSLNFWSTVRCYRIECGIWARVNKAEQRLYLYVDGQLTDVWATSTGVAGHGTPNFDTHPNGRIYDAYTSTKYPGGDYMGLGNMPYAVFISGGFAIHGTGTGNWAKLGRPASHGCVRVHPDNAKVLNRLVRQYGVNDTWITIE